LLANDRSKQSAANKYQWVFSLENLIDGIDFWLTKYFMTKLILLMNCIILPVMPINFYSVYRDYEYHLECFKRKISLYKSASWNK
jgi:hypothetical protein